MLFQIIWGVLLIHGVWWIISLVAGWQNKFWRTYFYIIGRIVGYAILLAFVAFVFAPLTIGIYMAASTGELKYLQIGWVTVAFILLSLFKKNMIRTTIFTYYKNGKEDGKHKITERV